MIIKLQDYLNTLNVNSPQWYGWAKAEGDREVYEHLIIHNASITKPTEQECIDGVSALQAIYDNAQYARSRASAYPSLADQADMQYHDAIDGTTTWQDAITAVKAEFPKP